MSFGFRRPAVTVRIERRARCADGSGRSGLSDRFHHTSGFTKETGNPKCAERGEAEEPRDEVVGGVDARAAGMKILERAGDRQEREERAARGKEGPVERLVPR